MSEKCVNHNEFGEFVEVHNDGRDKDMLAFADQSERSDYSSNMLKANCVSFCNVNNHSDGTELVIVLF